MKQYQGEYRLKNRDIISSISAENYINKEKECNKNKNNVHIVSKQHNIHIRILKYVL
jgi:hypothetical protein